MKPCIQSELDAWNKEMLACHSVGGECPYPGACRIQKFCNCGGGVQPGVNTLLRGRTHERVCIGKTKDNVPVYEHVWVK